MNPYNPQSLFLLHCNILKYSFPLFLYNIFHLFMQCLLGRFPQFSQIATCFDKHCLIYQICIIMLTFNEFYQGAEEIKLS